LGTREAIAKMGRTVLAHPAHNPDVAPSDYHLFSPVKDALLGRHFADDNEMIQSFRYVLRIRGREFATLVHSILLNDGKSVLKMTETVEK
jgi:hypothetical protein